MYNSKKEIFDSIDNYYNRTPDYIVDLQNAKYGLQEVINNIQQKIEEIDKRIKEIKIGE
jgi:archaellum component FlaC